MFIRSTEPRFLLRKVGKFDSSSAPPMHPRCVQFVSPPSLPGVGGLGARRCALARTTRRLRVRVICSSAAVSERERTRSPYELVNLRRSRFVAHLNELKRRKALPSGAVPDAPSSLERALRSAGAAHEARVVERIASRVGATPVTITGGVGRANARIAHELTASAVAAREPVILQAGLSDGFLGGYADVLVRDADNPYLNASARRMAAPNAYSVFEVKLSSTARVDYALQAGAYARMLPCVGAECRHAFLWLGGGDENVAALDVGAVHYLLERCTDDFRSFLHGFNVGVNTSQHQLPEIDAPLADLRPWTGFAQQLLDLQDSLLNISNIRRSQARFIQTQLGTNTLTDFANLSNQQLISALSLAIANDDYGASPSGVQGRMRNAKRRKRRAIPTPQILTRLQEQAQLQRETESNEQGYTAHRVLGVNESAPFGLDQIAPIHENDVYFDIEGYPLYEQHTGSNETHSYSSRGGIEYLLGLTEEKDDGATFHYWWAHDRAQEEQAFIQLITHLWNRVDGRVYHYGHYEVTALRRVAARATTVAGREAGRRLESMLAARRFVDIYKAVRGGLLVGARSYSIKKVEHLVGVSRVGDELADAQSSVAMYHQWCYSDKDEKDDKLLADILHYNRQDCESLRSVVHWLRNAAEENGIQYRAVPQFHDPEQERGENHRDASSATEACGRTAEDKSKDAEVIARSDHLTAFLLGTDVEQLQNKGKHRVSSSAPKHAQIIAHLLQWHSRERAPVRFLFMDRVTKAYCNQVAELHDNHECVVIDALSEVDSSKTVPVYHMSYDESQPISLKKGSSVAIVVGARNRSSRNGSSEDETMIASFGSVVECENGVVAVRAKGDNILAPDDSIVLVRSDELTICAAPMRANLLRTAEECAEHGRCLHPMVQTFLTRTPPTSQGAATETLDMDALRHRLHNLDGRVIAIQGPPGSGKTTTSAKLIANLLGAGKRVAVTSNSHAAIDNLLVRTLNVADVDAKCVVKVGTRPEVLSDLGARTAPSVDRALAKDGLLVGATAYALARAEDNVFDVIFVDEASQVSMANFVSTARAARGAVLVGDQQQLQMPVQGSHAPIVAKSCLTHFVGEAAVVDPTRGVFLDTSYRMQEDLCKFVSDNFYAGALQPHHLCAENSIMFGNEIGNDGLVKRGAGLAFIRMGDAASEDDGFGSGIDNACGKANFGEARVVRRVVEQLLDSNTKCRVSGKVRTLNANDVLVVAPYNAQVGAVRRELGDVIDGDEVRVGTVDRFQGLEAPVVIVSSCVSDATSGDEETTDERAQLEFVTNANRLNVAISRASCLAIVVGSGAATMGGKVESLEAARSFGVYEQLSKFGDGSHVGM